MRSSLFGFLFALMFGFVGSARAQFSPAERAKLIEDAKKEGKVVFYTGASANDGNALKAAFEKKYPFLRWNTFAPAKISCWESI